MAQFQTEIKKRYSQDFTKGVKEFEADRVKLQSLVDNQRLRNAAVEDDNLKTLTDFSSTAAGWFKQLKEKDVADEESNDTAVSLSPGGVIKQFGSMDAALAAQEKYESDQNVIKEEENTGERTIQAAEKEGSVNFSFINNVRELSGGPSWRRSQTKVDEIMRNWNTVIYDRLKDPDRVYTLANGETFRLGDLNKDTKEGQAKYAFALGIEKLRYIKETGLYKYNTRLMAKHVPNLLITEEAWLKGKQAEIDITASDEVRKNAWDNFNMAHGSPDINGYINEIRRTVDGKNNFLDYKGAHEHLRNELLSRYESGELTEQQIEAILDTTITEGQYKGETLESAFPKVFGINLGEVDEEGKRPDRTKGFVKHKDRKGLGTFRMAFDKIRVRRSQAISAQERAHDDEIERQLREITDPNEYKTLMDSMYNPPKSVVQRYDRLSAEPASPDEASRAAEYLNVLWEANELHPEDHADIINRLPAQDREEWFRRAKTQWTNKKTGAYQKHLTPIINPIKKQLGAIEVENQLQVTRASGHVIIELENKYKQEFLANIRGKRKDDGTWEIPPMDADEAAEKASTTVAEYYKKEGGGQLYEKGTNEEGRYLKIIVGEDEDGEMVINEFPNFNGGIKDFITEKTKLSNRIRDLRLDYGATKVSKFKALGQLIPELSEEALKSQDEAVGKFGIVNIDDQIRLAAQQLGMAPIDLINAQRKLYNLEPLTDKLTLNINKRDYNNLIYNPTPNTSIRALASHNKEQFDPTSVPGGWGYTLETTVPGLENLGAAVIEAVNENWDLVPEDIDDVQNIIEQGGDWNTLYSLLTEQGIDGHQLNKCAFKYGVKDSNGLPVTCVRPTLQIAN